MNVIGELAVRLTADSRKFATQVQKQAQQAGDAGGKSFAEKFTKGLAIVGGGAAIGAFLKSSIDNASDLNETVAKMENVFGDAAPAITEWAKNSVTQFGLTKGAALDAAASFGDMFLQLGFNSKAATESSTAVVQLATDLGSFNNLPTEDVLAGMASAFRGEYDSIQRVLPAMKGANVEQKALAMTGKASAKELTDQERATAALALMQEYGARAANDFAETSDGVANKSKIVKAQFETLKTTIGQAFLSVMSLLLDTTSTLITKGGELFDFVKRNLPVIATVATAIGLVTIAAYRQQIALGLLRVAMVLWGIVTNIVTIATTLWAGAIWLVNGALAVLTSPITLVIAAIVAVIAIIVLAWKHNETFRKVVTAAWEAIKNAVKVVVDWLVGTAWPFIQKVWDGIKKGIEILVTAVKWYIAIWLAIVITAWNIIRDAAKAVWGWLSPFVTAILDGIKAYISGWVTAILWVWDKVKKVWSIVSEAFSTAYSKVKEWLGKIIGWVKPKVDDILQPFKDAVGKMKEIGGNIVRGIWDGIKGLWGWLKSNIISFVSDALPGPVKKVLGIASPSKVFAGIGENVVLGLREGIADSRKGLIRDMDGLVPNRLAYAGSLSGVGFGAAAPVVQVYVGNEPIENAVVRVNGRLESSTAARLVSGGVS